MHTLLSENVLKFSCFNSTHKINIYFVCLHYCSIGDLEKVNMLHKFLFEFLSKTARPKFNIMKDENVFSVSITRLIIEH